jgi:hypothetical protein
MSSFVRILHYSAPPLSYIHNYLNSYEQVNFYPYQRYFKIFLVTNIILAGWVFIPPCATTARASVGTRYDVISRILRLKILFILTHPYQIYLFYTHIHPGFLYTSLFQLVSIFLSPVNWLP